MYSINHKQNWIKKLQFYSCWFYNSDYDIVNYPLTDQMEDKETLGDPPEPSFVSSRQVTSLTEGEMTRENTENPAAASGKCLYGVLNNCVIISYRYLY